MSPKPSVAEVGTRLGLRALTTLGSLPLMNNLDLRRRVEAVLYHGTKQGLRVETVARRSFRKVTSNARPARVPATAPKGLFDLTPTEEQQMIADVAAELADEKLRPMGSQADTDRHLPDDVRKAASQLGLTMVGIPSDLGGIADERSAVTGVLVLEQLARGDMGLATALMSAAAVANALANYGDASQQNTYLPAFADEHSVAQAALAMMEPQPLFDALNPATTGDLRTDKVVLNGTKALVPGAAEAELFVVSAMVEGRPRLVIIEPGTQGVSTSDDPAMGIRAANTGRLHLKDVWVPKANLLGSADDHLDAVRRSRLAWCAAAMGTGQAVLDMLIPYVKERKAFGEPIANRQAVAFTVADIGIELAGLRLSVLRAAALLDAGQDAAMQIAKARRLTATYGAQIGSNAVQMLGGHGFVKEYDNERWYRDLRGAGVLEGGLLV